MDLISNLLPPVPTLELDNTSPWQNMTLLQNAFFVTFLTSLAYETVRNILGESVIVGRIMQAIYDKDELQIIDKVDEVDLSRKSSHTTTTTTTTHHPPSPGTFLRALGYVGCHDLVYRLL